MGPQYLSQVSCGLLGNGCSRSDISRINPITLQKTNLVFYCGGLALEYGDYSTIAPDGGSVLVMYCLPINMIGADVLVLAGGPNESGQHH